MGLKELRERQSWSADDLARAAGLATGTVERAEAGATRPQRVTLRLIAGTLGLEAADLAEHLSGRGEGLAERLRRPDGARACAVPECPEPHIARGWCMRHYQRWRKHGDPLMLLKRAAAVPRPRTLRPTVEERFWRRVDKHEGGCWLWTGALDRAGYAPFWQGPGRGGYAHQMAYTLAHGQLPAGMLLANRCGRRSCVNPDHWQLSTLAAIGRANRGKKRHRPGR